MRSEGVRYKYPPVFSGDRSRDMWEEVRCARTVKELRWALYTVCCQLQELEHHLTAGDYGRDRTRKAEHE